MSIPTAAMPWWKGLRKKYILTPMPEYTRYFLDNIAVETPEEPDFKAVNGDVSKFRF